jgi:hypothetical protein
VIQVVLYVKYMNMKHGEKIEMTIIEFFDPNNIEHIKAFVHLQNTGIWPNYFITTDITFPLLWQTTLMSKMTDKWVEYKLKGK